MSESKQTPLHPIYARYGARVVEFAGWSLPVQFSGIAAEHLAVRKQAGLFDVSHMGEVRVTGRDSLDFLQHVLANDCAKLAPGRVLYSPMCYPDGGCVDDLLVYMFGPTDYLLVVNAANTEKDLAWLQANKGGFAVAVEDQSSSYAQLALQGPKAAAIARTVAGEAPLALGYYSFLSEIRVAGRPCLVSRTGYTGEDGFEFYTAPEHAIHVWEALLQSGEAVPAGLGARDTLRLEAGMPLYGHELSPEITPIEAGLTRFVGLSKPRFNGREPLLRQVEHGAPRRLIGLEMDVRGVPRAACPVLQNTCPIGTVTSGTLSPLTDRPIAMALVRTEAARDQAPLAIRIRDKDYPAHPVTLPFYKRRRI